jgi:hypothetical protein
MKLISQESREINYLLTKPDNQKYRWNNCIHLISRYSQQYNWNAAKLQTIINILSSDEDKINTTLADYWRTHWVNKSNEIKELAQKEFDRNNTQRGNQLTNDAKFAEQISTSIDGKIIADITIKNIISGLIKPQGNALNLPKEQNLQNFRMFFATNYNSIYKQLWEPKQENIPANYIPAPYIYNSYSLLGPTAELMHTFVDRTFGMFFTALNLQLFSKIDQGEAEETYNYSYGFSLKGKFNFSIIHPLYEKQMLLLSNNSFKESLEPVERKNIEGIFWGHPISWNIVTNIGYTEYNIEYSLQKFYNFYFSLGSGVNYRFSENFTTSFNFYYLGFDYQIQTETIDFTKGIWYYVITPEIEARINVFDLFYLNPYINYHYHFKGEDRLSSLNGGLGITFFFGTITYKGF